MTAHVRNSYIRKVICNSWGGRWRASQMVPFSSKNKIHVKPRFSKYSSERLDTNFNKIFTFDTLQSGNFWIPYEYGIVWTLKRIFFSSSYVTRSSPVLYNEYLRWWWAQCYRSFISWTSVSSPLTCVQLNLAVITINFSYAKRRLDILRRLFRSEGRIGR